MSQTTYLYLLYNEIIYDPLCNIYTNILTLNKQPEGLLKTYTKLMSLAKPSSRDLITNECVIVINNALLNNNLTNNNYNSKSILTLNELNEFTEFLINNNYIITEHCYNTNNNTNSSKKIIYSFKITI
jgi:hypothetical protein